MSQFEEVVIDSDEDAASTGCAPSRQLAEECPPFRVAYDEWMHCPDYGASGHEILFVTDQVPDLPHQSRWIADAARNINNKISTDEVLEQDLIGLSLTAWGHVEQHPVVVMGMRQKAQVNLSILLKAFEGIKRDRPAFLTKGPLVVKVKHVKRSTQQPFSDVRHFQQRCLNKKSILTAGSTQSPVENLSRALAISKAYIQRNESARLIEKYKKLRSQNEIHLKTEADALRKMARGRAEDSIALAMRRFDRYFSKMFTITVFAGLDGRHVLFESWAPPVSGRPHMDVVTDGRAFHVVTDVSVAFSSGQMRQYCRHCRVHYHFETEHQCLECCRHCRKVGVCVPGHGVSCKMCKRDFVNDSCFMRHLDENRAGKSTCDLLKMCSYCLEWYGVEGRRKRHICGDRFCKNCKEKCSAVHICHATRQSNQAVATVDARRHGRPLSVGGSTGDSDSAKRRRLDVDAVPGATQGRTAAVPQSTAASTSCEPADERDNVSSEMADVPAASSSDPSTRSSNISTAARPCDSSRSTGGGVVSRQNTSAGPSLRDSSPPPGNLPSGREAVRDGQQGGGAAASADTSTEGGGPTPPHPVRALHYPQQKKVVVFY